MYIHMYVQYLLPWHEQLSLGFVRGQSGKFHQDRQCPAEVVAHVDLL